MRNVKILILTVIMLFSISFSGLAIDIPDEAISESSFVGGGELEPQDEHTRWYYRTVDGVTEKRLWSVTYGVWLTDWMPVNTEPVT